MVLFLSTVKTTFSLRDSPSCCLKGETQETKDHQKGKGNVQLLKGSSVHLQRGQLVGTACSGEEELKRLKEWADSLMLISEKLNGIWLSKLQSECLVPTS